MLIFRTILFILILMPSTEAAEVEIGGLIIDRSISRQGRDFYRHLSTYWRDVPSSITSHNVVVKEVIIPHAGTRLFVSSNDRIYYGAFLGRRHNDIEKMAQDAILILIDGISKQHLTGYNQDLSASGY